MSFLSALGKIGKGALHLATGNIPGLIEDVGGVLGQGGASAAAGRRGDADLQARMNAANNRAQLDAAQFNLQAPQARLGQATRADVLANTHNAPLTGDARIDKFAGGGLRPDLFMQDTRNGANALKKEALLAIMTGSDKVHPAMSTIPKAGFLEKLGGAAGLVGGVAGAIGGGGPMGIARSGEHPDATNPYVLYQRPDFTGWAD